MNTEAAGGRWPPDMAARNRWVLAGRLGWPEGAVGVCERLEREYPGWVVWWLGEWTVSGWERAAGFYAWAVGDMPLVKAGLGYRRRREWYGVDAEAVEKQLRDRP